MRAVKLQSLFILLSVFLTTMLSAQGFDRPNGFGGSVLFIDHASFQDEAESGFGEMTTGFEFSYSRFLNKFISVRVPFKGGLSSTGDSEFAKNRSFFGVDFTVQASYFGNEAKVAPFVYAGYGGTKEEGQDVFYQIPVGGGLNFRIGRWGFFQLKAEYRPDLNNDLSRTNMQYGFGLAAVVGPTQTTKEIEQMLSDTDGDGVDNDRDKCPDIPGKKLYSGCPDSDNDGIGDADDSCPDEVGLKSLNGCPDADADGVADIVDDCPTVPGTASGCPDSDMDGVADANDKCPDVAGAKGSAGCPEDENMDSNTDVAEADVMTAKGADKTMADLDDDGFNNDEDDCPNEAGPAGGCPDADADGVADRFDACPDVAGALAGCPDSDSDGIADYKDTCPDKAGSATNFGCPEVNTTANTTVVTSNSSNNNYSNYTNPISSNMVPESALSLMKTATKTVQFKVLSDDLTDGSYDVLGQVIELMISNPNYRLKVAGHTDNRGDDSVNQRLSEKRARACVRYLRSQGVPEIQMSYIGYGARIPVSDNDTEYGRSQNRRVDFELYIVN